MLFRNKKWLLKGVLRIFAKKSSESELSWTAIKLHIWTKLPTIVQGEILSNFNKPD